MPVYPFSLLMVVDNRIDSLLKISRLLLWSEQFDSDSSSKRIEIFIQKQFFHLFVDDGQLILEDTSQDKLIIFILDIMLPFV